MAGPPEALHDLPDGVAETTAALDDLDRCFEHGFGRLGGDSMDALESIAASFTGTPLADRLDEAVDAVGQSRFDPEAFEAIAAARASLQGARYDAIVDHVCEVYGWDRPDVDHPDPRDPDDEIVQLLASTRQWLGEVAIAGFGSIEEDAVAPFESTLRELKAHDETRRLATLLSGFVRELLKNAPTASMASVPATRWTDCWTRAMVHATKLPGRGDGETVSGRVRILGADLRHHETAVSVVVHGLLTGEGVDGLRQVRITETTGKVDAVAGRELWRVFPDAATPVFEAVAQNLALDLEDATLYPTGDLVPGDAATGGEWDKLDLFEEYFADPAETDLTLAAHEPLDRHPAQIAVPAYLTDYDVDESVVDGDGGVSELPEMTFDDGSPSLRMDVERISPHSGMDVEHVAGSKRLGGLLRFDGGGWTVQPLVETKRSKRYYTGMDADPGATSDVAETLHERADKLLREKA